jgi:hypothetical protein
VTPDAPGSVACNDISDRQGRDERFGAVVGDSLQFTEYPDENTYQAKTNAFTAMKSDSTLLFQNNINDAAYQNFYNEMNQSNIGIFDSIRVMAADSSQIHTAITINKAIVDTNSIEYFKKEINNIQLTKTAMNQPLNAADSSFCDYVSSLSYYIAGDAIYSAAAMISKEIHPVYVPMRKATPEHEQKEKPLARVFKLFPNPASTSFKIEGAAANIMQIKVNSAEGKLIKAFKQPLQQEYSIAEIANGFYQVSLIEDSGRVSYLKLSIIR